MILIDLKYFLKDIIIFLNYLPIGSKMSISCNNIIYKKIKFIVICKSLKNSLNIKDLLNQLNTSIGCL